VNNISIVIRNAKTVSILTDIFSGLNIKTPSGRGILPQTFYKALRSQATSHPVTLNAQYLLYATVYYSTAQICFQYKNFMINYIREE